MEVLSCSCQTCSTFTGECYAHWWHVR